MSTTVDIDIKLAKRKVAVGEFVAFPVRSETGRSGPVATHLLTVRQATA
ncbi:hypothetical protein [Actinomadura mexicana]|uniref:Uncharacterized protein n=1 Tax=Actinomadura mexicana TaxID=134959 RepID=A0A239AWF8_9ACTN|nr:hypothetical protein [Actinomadura mexicana]SNR99900.1 hypothetical protein SAMN06265355_109251 [Actinomadura mexicana]